MYYKRDNWNEIVKRLKEKGLTIATMESCTGGGIANAITNISEASAVLKESYVTYCNEAKIKNGVSADVIAKYTAYSQQTAIEMAKAAKTKADSDIAIGVTGQLGKISPNDPIDKLNYVWLAIVNKNNEIFTRGFSVPNMDREWQKDVIVKITTMFLLDYI